MSKLFGDKAFYKKVIAIAIPIMLQQGISSFVNILDTLMIGNYDTNAMAGLSIANQLFFIVNILTIGAMGTAGIYLTQYFGSHNQVGMRDSFRLKLWIGLGICLLASFVFFFFGSPLIETFLTNPESIEEKNAILGYSHEYLLLLLFTLVPFVVSQAYSSSLRETGETIKPLIGGVIGVGVNALLNLWLIFGGLGVPSLGVLGAAIATITARFCEMFFLVIVTHRNKDKYIFIQNAYKSIKVPGNLLKNVLVKGAPLIFNEFMWSLGMTVLLNLYSVRGTTVLNAFSISNTTTNLFYIVFGAMATATSVMVGQKLGAGELEEAVDNDRKLIVFSCIVCLAFGIILACIAPFIPHLYKDASVDARELATQFMLVIAVCMVIFAFNSECFYTLRAGGVTFVTFLFDSLFIWVVAITSCYFLIHYTDFNIVLIYFIVQILELVKSVIGFALIKSKIWVKNLVTI